MKRTLTLIILTLALLLAACSQPTPAPTSAPAPTEAPTEAAPTAAPTEAPTEAPAPTEVPPTEEPTPEEPAAAEWPAPLEAEEAFTRAAVSEAEQATFDLLAATNYAANDPVALAVAIQGKPQPEPPPAEPPQLAVGATQMFWIHNTDTNEWSQIEARLERITEHAYFWFDTSREIRDPADLDRAAEGFETYYQATRDLYGEEASPGIDGDPRIYVMHASALALCDVAEDTAHQCGLLGYFSTTDTKPKSIEEHSNEHEMFVLNIDRAIGGEQYISTLIHEFRHMIEHNYDQHDDDWEVEGTATLAQLITGDTAGPKGRADAYVDNTDLQMNAWTQGNSHPHYGKGYVLSRYILDRMGPEFYAAWVQHPDRAFFGLDAVLADSGYAFNAHDLWLDFTAAVTLIGFENAAAPYTFSDDFLSAAPSTTSVNKFPKEVSDDVHQYAFDIYDLRGSAPVQVDFTGTTKTAVLENVVPASGQYMWWSGRANQSDMSLTREVDLTGVDTATLNYAVYYNLEKGYDFAYALVSTDGGSTWEMLESANMQGEADSDNPGDAALTERFYTGRAKEWAQESVDLSAYAGQIILIRFQYITDAIFTAPGLALDNISIPEIGFYDDIEALDDGWIADGFVRVTAYTPQRFHLVLVTFDAGGVPTVERIAIADDNTASFTISLTEESSRGFLIVTATNPLILSPAEYQFSFGE